MTNIWQKEQSSTPKVIQTSDGGYAFIEFGLEHIKLLCEPAPSTRLMPQVAVQWKKSRLDEFDGGSFTSRARLCNRGIMLVGGMAYQVTEQRLYTIVIKPIWTVNTKWVKSDFTHGVFSST